ncbi:hypothetical protein OOK31_13395 [Streptomyces sp. NBC_00249]|uniref:hypothetical protein n=1 Tax=Streptomyces sp. NBC_00249 TaxID=2975690 RepID=UPI00225539B3|nr:hypothetical protein [Streptomyces sp. NBC_00249]MCX5194883.1 hypothetical protein [Streptomyces sp. NBC_00249]
MSFGDPNNPYGQQPQAPQGQPGYGYPQQAPQGVPAQGGYGYPAGAAQAYPGGYPGGPVTMPGGVKAARVMLWVIAGLQVIGIGVLFAAIALIQKLKDEPELQGNAQFEDMAKLGSGVLYALIALAVVYMIASIVLAIQMGKGGNGARIGTIVYASLGLVLSLYPFFPLSLVHLVLLILIIVFVAKSDGAAWFNRQR